MLDNKIEEGNLSKIKEIEKNLNFRKNEFYHNKKYELGVSIYSNAIFIIVTANGKMGSIYQLETSEEEEADTEFIPGLTSEEPQYKLPELKSAECLIGDRRDERNQFIANIILSFVSKEIQKKNQKIKTFLFSISDDKFNSKSFDLDENTQNFIKELKEALSKVLAI